MKFPPRYELVFALDAQTTDALIDSTSRRMPTSSSGESVCDLYYESSSKKLRAKGKTARRQYRVRRIDRAWDVSLESLSWERDLCSLRQTVVPSSDLARLHSDEVDKSWSGKWFHKSLVKNSLAPGLETHFDSTTWKCDSLDGEICLTVDSDIQVIGATSNSSADLTANVVRMNYSVSLPSVFKALIYEFALLPEQPTVLLKLAKAAAKQSIINQLPLAPVAFSVVDEATSPMDRSGLTGLVASTTTATQEVATCQLG